MTGAMSLLGDMGVKYHTREGGRGRPTRHIPRLGFEADTCYGVVKLEERKIVKGMRLREEIFGSTPCSESPARALLATVSFLNFMRWPVAGSFCHMRSGWGAANESGAMEQ